MVYLNNTCEITIVIRTPELTVDCKCLSVNVSVITAGFSSVRDWKINRNFSIH